MAATPTNYSAPLTAGEERATLIPPTAVRTGSYLLQVYSTVRRQITQKRRAPLTLLLEVVLPCLFIALLSFIASVSDVTEVDGQQFVDNSAPRNPATEIDSYVCYDDSAASGGSDAYLLSVLGSCSTQPASASITCNVNGSSTFDPSMPQHVCGIDLMRRANTIRFDLSNFETDLQLLNFDSFVKMQWMIRLQFGTASSSIFDSDGSLASLRASGKLFFVPQTQLVRDLVDNLNTTHKLFRVVFGGFADSRDALMPYIKSVEGEGSTWAIIEASASGAANKDVSFTIACNSSAVPSTRTVRDQFSRGLGSHPYSDYYTSGFLTLQQVLSKYFLQSVNASLPTTPREELISVAPMPFASYKDNVFYTVSGRIAPLVQVLSFLYTVSQLSKRLVEEKEQRLREGTMIMGLTRAAFFSSWMLVYYAQVLVTSILCSIMAAVWLLNKTSFIISFFLYFGFGMTVVNVSALLSTFFNKSRIAGLVVPLLYFMISIPSFALPEGTSAGVYVILSWLPTMPFAVGNILLFNYQTTTGLGASDIANPNDTDPYNMAACYAFFVLNIVFCPLIMLWLDAVLPKEWGTRKPVCYCVTSLFCKNKNGRNRGAYTEIDGEEIDDARIGSPLAHMKNAPVAVDDYPSFIKDATVHIRKVRREFDTPAGKKIAVDDVDLKMFPNQVTVLLGHNGAGKTTLMNMMTGMIDLTDGDVQIYNMSVHHNLNAVRRNVGYCPQHNILWDDLTCIEHLRYFARLKGVPSNKVESEAVRLLDRVDLLDKKDVFSKQLSGGQKRKLSVAIAFIGGSQLILLDEPTAGMDVTARRHTWEIIREMSEGRTILLTTHFMDEADLLGSRIAIMSKGRLHSYGSPMFLKSKLGSGYVFRVSHTHTVTDGGDGALAEAKKFIGNVSIREVKGQEVALSLHSEDAPSFPKILRHFESAEVKKKHGIAGVSMTVSTLEDVFLRIAEEEEHDHIVPADGTTVAATPTTPTAVDVEQSAMKEAYEVLERSYNERSADATGATRGRQLLGLIVKRFHYARRDNRTIFFQLAMPLLCLLLAMLLSYLSASNDSPQLYFDAGMYGSTAQLTSINEADGIDKFYANDGYNVNTQNLSTTQQFSYWLQGTYNSNGKQERFTSVARKDTTFDASYAYTTLFTNASAPHSAPEALRDYYTNVARQTVAANTNSNKDLPSLSIASWPLPLTERQTGQVDAIKHLMVALFVLIPFTFIPSTYVAYIVKERECKAKHLQFVSGVKYGIYWLSNFLFDILAFAFTVGCSIIIFFIFNRTEFIGDGEQTICTIAVLMLYGISGIFAAYAISFFFQNHSSAQNIVMISNFIIGFCLVIACYFMSNIDSTKGTMKWLIYVFRMFPAFCLGEGIMNIAVADANNKLLGEHKSPFVWNTTGCDLVFMAGSSVIYMLITLIIDHPKRKEKQRMIGFDANAKAPMPAEEDDDVAAEREAVEKNQRPDDVIVVKGLRKVYPLGIGKEKVAVQNITFGVPQGEVFGFLGTNGAGKTTTMGVLTGEFVPTMGEAYVAGYDVVRDAQEAFKVIGYCPQFDALFDLLTPAEHLALYAALRGIPANQTAAVVDALILACGLTEFRKIPAMRLSGGNKRKLSVAVSLVGSPKLVFLDEPSAGMDPHARRQLWDVIVYIAKHSSVLLTTHHLEEVDVLAHRVGIMDKGLMKCMGSLEHLKRKFGSGFELTIRVADHAGELKVVEFVKNTFADATLVESREQRLVFALSADSTCLADLFEGVQNAQKDPNLGIADYIVQQTSLENVFMKITAEAEAAEHHAGDGESNNNNSPTDAANAAATGTTAVVNTSSLNTRSSGIGTPLTSVQPSGTGYAAYLSSKTNRGN